MHSFTYKSSFPLKCTDVSWSSPSSDGIRPSSLLFDRSKISIVSIRKSEQSKFSVCRQLYINTVIQYQHLPWSLPSSVGIDWLSAFDERFKTFRLSKMPIAEGILWSSLLPAKHRSERWTSLETSSGISPIKPCFWFDKSSSTRLDSVAISVGMVPCQKSKKMRSVFWSEYR